MKPIISNDLKNRIQFAAANGSTIATDLLTAIKNCKDLKDETDRNINYFDTKRIVDTCSHGQKSIRVVVTCCRKDLTNKNFPDFGNPQAPHFPENRSDISVHDFALVFKAIHDKEYDDTEWIYFDSAMRLASKVKFRIGTTMADFIKAYDFSNYIGLSESSTSTLHGSCMRYEGTARSATDFYVNFAGAKILIGETSEGEVVSRAVLWDNVEAINYTYNFGFMDRIYTAFDGFLITAMKNAALKAGYKWRKTCNDYSHKINFTPLEDTTLGDLQCYADQSYTFSLVKKVPDVKMHKEGAPYCDTMSYLYYNPTDFQMILTNTSSLSSSRGKCVASLESTSGYGSKASTICPVCGEANRDCNEGGLCDSCKDGIITQSPFGAVIKYKTITYKGKLVPAFFIHKGKPTPAFNAYIALSRITEHSLF